MVMKKFSVFASAVLAVTLCSCTSNAAVDPASEPVQDDNPSVQAKVEEPFAENSEEQASLAAEAHKEIAAAWKNVGGVYTREDSAQYNNGSLMLAPMENDRMLFNFRLMSGSENEECVNYNEAGILGCGTGAGTFDVYLDHDGPVTQPDGTILFTPKDGGKTIVVSHTGSIPYPCDGRYIFSYKEVDVSETAVKALLEELPPAATSLNIANKGYKIKLGDDLLKDCFYSVKAVAPNGSTIASFLVGKDLDFVYRLDVEGGKPMAIYGKPDQKVEALVKLVKP